MVVDIDLTRPIIKNKDNSFSTEKTITIGQDGKFLNIPTIINGREVSEQDAIEHANRTGENFGVFNSKEAAVADAEKRSFRIGELRGNVEEFEAVPIGDDEPINITQPVVRDEDRARFEAVPIEAPTETANIQAEATEPSPERVPGEPGALESILEKTGILASREDLREQIEKNRQPGAFKRILQESVAETAALAPFVLAPAGASSLALKSLLTVAGKQVAISGISSFVRRVAEGEDVQSAATGAAREGGTAGLVSFVAPFALEGGGRALGMLGRSLSGIPKWALKRASTNPSLITEAQEPIAAVGEKMLNSLDEFAALAQQSFDDGLNRVPIKPGRSVKVGNIGKLMADKKVPVDVFANQVKLEANRQFIDLSDDALSRFVQGGKGAKLTYEEARQINTILHHMTFSRASERIGTAGAGVAKNIKAGLMEQIEKAGPGTREVFKTYSTKVGQYQTLRKIAKNAAERSETTLRTIGQQMAGAEGKGRTGIVNLINTVDDQLPATSKFGNDIIDSVVGDAFSRIKNPSIGTLATGLAVGGLAGQQVGAPVGGALLGGASVLAGRSPEVIKGAVAGTRVARETIAPIAGRVLPPAAAATRRGL